MVIYCVWDRSISCGTRLENHLSDNLSEFAWGASCFFDSFSFKTYLYIFFRLAFKLETCENFLFQVFNIIFFVFRSNSQIQVFDFKLLIVNISELTVRRYDFTTTWWWRMKNKVSLFWTWKADWLTKGQRLVVGSPLLSMIRGRKARGCWSRGDGSILLRRIKLFFDEIWNKIQNLNSCNVWHKKLKILFT